MHALMKTISTLTTPKLIMMSVSCFLQIGSLNKDFAGTVFSRMESASECGISQGKLVKNKSLYLNVLFFLFFLPPILYEI